MLRKNGTYCTQASKSQKYRENNVRSKQASRNTSGKQECKLHVNTAVSRFRVPIV